MKKPKFYYTWLDAYEQTLREQRGDVTVPVNWNPIKLAIGIGALIVWFIVTTWWVYQTL